jgi:hypothetical protein
MGMGRGRGGERRGGAGQFPWRHSVAPASASGCAHGRGRPLALASPTNGVPTGMGTFRLLIASMRLHWRGRRVRNAPKSARPHLTRKSTRLSLRPRWRRFTPSGKELTPLQSRTVSELQLALAALTSVPICHRTRLAQPPALEAPSI